jgi:GTPase SAR1 family protein
MSEVSNKKILVLGARWSGKSLLIKRLNDSPSSNKGSETEFISTTSTSGKTITLVQYKRPQKLELHELGAPLACSWQRFHTSDHFEKILYVIDATQPWAMSFTLQQLKEIFEQTTITSKQILLVLNKVNEINSLTRTVVHELLDLDSLWNGQVELIEVNARTGLNLLTLLERLTH